jgi:hypothetical protein
MTGPTIYSAVIAVIIEHFDLQNHGPAMSNDAKQLVTAFASLAPPERYAVMVELAGISEADAGGVSDDELAIAGAEIFSMYDAEEGASGDTKTR